MPRLVRLRFVSLGHANARFDDLVLDLRDAAGRATDSTLWLRNGGGKSSILNLVFGLIRPGRRDFLGGKAEARKRRIEDYVGANDHGVVAAEWELDAGDGLSLDDEPQRYLTGVFLEWRSGKSEDDTRLRRLFFAGRASRTSPQLDIESLPLFTERGEGRRGRRTLLSFRQEWSTLRDTYPHLELAYTEHQGEWARRLDEAGIDPELFGYQIRMNLREGGVDELFRFAEHEQFVDFLLELALDPALGERVNRNVGTYRRELRERKHALLPERELLDGVATRLEPVAGIAAERELVRERVAGLRRSIDGLQAHVNARCGELGAEIKAARAEHEAERTAAASCEASGHEAKSRAAMLRRFAAESRLRKAEAGVEDARRAMEAADREYKVWDAAVPLWEALRHEHRATQWRAELERRQTEAAPLLGDLWRAAADLAGALAYRSDAIRKSARLARDEESKCRRDARAAWDSATACEVRAARAQAEIERLQERIEDAERERAGLEAASFLRASEAPEDALDLTRKELESREERLRELSETIQSHERRTKVLHDEHSKSFARAGELSGQANEVRAAVEEASKERCALETDPVLRAFLEVESIDLEQLPDQAVAELGTAARASLEEMVRIRVARAGDDRAVLQLEETGLLPPTLDAERVHKALRSRLPGVWTGWTYIEANVGEPEHRRVVIEQVPERAMGLVVRDEDFQAARTIVEALDPPPETPVVVVAQSTFLEHTGQTTSRIVAGPASDAYFDRESASRELVHRRARLDEADAELARHDQEYRDLEVLIGRLRLFRERHPHGWFEGQAKRLREAERGAESYAGRAQAIERELEKIAQEREQAIADCDECREATTRSRAAMTRLESFIHRCVVNLGAWSDRSSAESQRRDDAREERSEWLSEAERLEGAAESAAAQAAKHGEDARAVHEEQTRVEYVEGAVETRSGDVDRFRDRYAQLKGQYEQKVGADGLLQLQQEAETEARRQREKLAPLLDINVHEGLVREALAGFEDFAQVDDRRRAAAEHWMSAKGSLGNQTQVVERARDRLLEIQGECTRLGISPLIPHSEMPVGPVQAEEAAKRAETEAEEHFAASRKHAERADAAEAVVADAKRRVGELGLHSQYLNSIVDIYARLLGPAGKEDAPPVTIGDDRVGAEIEHISAALKSTQQDIEHLDSRRAAAVRDLRRWTGEARFDGLKCPIGRRISEVEPEQLEVNAKTWRDEIALRGKVIDEQLAEMDTHRDMLVDEALAAAEDGLRLLRTATRQSRLPETVPALGGAQFLRVLSHEPDDRGERRGRIGELIDEIVDEGELPGGLGLVQRAVRKIGRPLRVKVLSPDPDLERKAVDIVDMARFSGGEQLTGAILLYCTLARLRARSRGAVRAASSVLILDNPIGRASRVRFLELQREVARAMGVQLFYTTAVNDHDALRALPNVIRMRNERIDRRTGHRLVERSPDAASHIEAARVVRSEKLGVSADVRE